MTKNIVALKNSVRDRLVNANIKLVRMQSAYACASDVVMRVSDGMSPRDALGLLNISDDMRVLVKAVIDITDPGLFDEAEREF